MNYDLLNLVYIHKCTQSKSFNLKSDFKSLNKAFKENIKGIESIESFGVRMSDSSAWIMDNFFFIENESIKLLNEDYMKLNKFNCVKENNEISPRVYSFCSFMVKNFQNVFEECEFINKLEEYESEVKLSLKEIWSVPFFLKYSILKNIYEIVEEVHRIEIQKKKAHSLFISSIKLINHGKIKLAFRKLYALLNNNVSLYMIEYIISLFNENKIEDKSVKELLNKVLKNENLTYEEIKKQNEKHLNEIRVKISMYIESIKKVSLFDWKFELERISLIHKEFLKDPSGIYEKMDYDSRNFYRTTLEKICSKNNLNEHIEAVNIINLCEKGNTNYTRHVGYYLIDDGSKIYRNIKMEKSLKKLYYFGSIFLGSVAIEISLLKYFDYLFYAKHIAIFLSILFLILIGDAWINLINYIFLNNVEKTFVPKLDYSKKIPDECKTMVTIPALLTSKEDIDELFKNLEISYICNDNDNIYFSILFDYVDTISYEGFDDKILLSYAKKCLKDLNHKYRNKVKETKFYVFTRNKVYVDSEKIYMGWERKRGKIMEFIKFIKGRESNYVDSIEDYPILKDIKYIITIDSDTKLMKNSAFKLIGCIDHVLNKAVVRTIRRRNKVIRGYGIVQPKVNVSFKSSIQTIYSKIFVGDVSSSYYNSLSSNIYQDVFSESIFIGKGIFDVDVFDEILWDAIPNNRVLSHDLIEGCFTRVLLSSDISIEEGFPSNILSNFCRLHRWIRGDWQLFPYLFRGRGINLLSKYKIFDNMRRSLIPLSFIICMVFPFLANLGVGNYYYGLLVLSLLFPLIFDLSSLTSINVTREKFLKGFSSLKDKLVQVYIMFSFIPYQAYLVLNAITKVFVRMIFTKKYILEWKSFQEVEKSSKNSIYNYIEKMFSNVLFGLLTLGFSFYLDAYEMILPSFVFLTSPFIAFYLSRRYGYEKSKINYSQNLFLRALSRSIFAYFEDFSSEATNYLICDNYQEDPSIGIVKRTSPTNIGMSLSTFVLARDFGFITVVDTVNRIKNIINSIELLPIYRGHLYNWYDIENMVPLGDRYVSTVDSGNLLASYYLCKKSLEDILTKPIIHKDLIKAFEEMAYLSNNFNEEHLYREVVKKGYACSDYVSYIKFLEELKDKSLENISKLSKDNIDVYWHIKINESANNFLNEILQITDSLHEIPNFKLHNFGELFINENIISLKEKLLKFKNDYNNLSVKSNVVDLKISQVINNVEEIINNITYLIEKIDFKIDSMDFKFLYNKGKNLMSIGYDCENDLLDENCYDLLASEVRIASFLAISKGDIPIEHWFKLGRLGVNIGKTKTLMSWSGTMFEYLMPMLYMKAYPETLFYETYKGCVKAQTKYAWSKRMPFGISESCFYEFDSELNYQYKAFGVPNLSIKKDYNNLVVSPYSSIMSLMVDFKKSMKNIKNLNSLGALGRYGFYEALDFTKERNRDRKYSIVKNYMAHHQGMSFMALSNVLMESLCQKRFENILQLSSVCELLTESLSNISINKVKENKFLSNACTLEDEFIPRIVKYKKDEISDMQIYSNENCFLGISSSGGGYLKFGNDYVSKLSSDFTNENVYGSIYIKDTDSGEFFTNTYLPCKNDNVKYVCEFKLNKVKFRANSSDMQVISEILISNDDNVEVRKLIIKNLTSLKKNIEVTTYFESEISNETFDYVEEKSCVICGNSDDSKFMGHGVYYIDDNISGIEFENSKECFIGRGGSLENPFSMRLNSNYGNTRISNNGNFIMSLRLEGNLNPHSHISLYFINVFEESKENVISLMDKYTNLNILYSLFNDNLYGLKVMINDFKISPLELSLFNFMTSRILYGMPNKNYELNSNLNVKDIISHNVDISIPIVSVEISSMKDLKNVETLVKSYVYFMNKGFKFNLIILNSYLGYDKCIEDEIDKLILYYDLKDKINVDNGVYVILCNLYKSACEIVKNISNIFIKGGSENIYDQLGFVVKDFQEVLKSERTENLIIPKNSGPILNKNIIFQKYLFEMSNEISDYEGINKYSIPKRMLKFYNSYGGFSKNYSEYVLKLNDFNITPEYYRNVLKNDYISTMISSRGFMSTWAFDCREFSITEDLTKNSYDCLGEALYIKEDGDIWSPTINPISNGEDYIFTNSYNYFKFKNKYREMETLVECFVPDGKKYKVLKITFSNLSSRNRILNLYYFAPLAMSSHGDYSKKLSTYINEDYNYIYGENNFSKNFKNIKSYLKLFGYDSVMFTGSKKEFLGVNSGYFNPSGASKDKLSNLTGVHLESCLCSSGKISLSSGEVRETYIILGYDDSIERINSELNKLTCDKGKLNELYFDSLDNGKNKYKDFQIKTQDEYLDAIFNGWILHQNENEKFLLSNSRHGELNSCVDLMEKCLIYNYTDSNKSKKTIIRVFSNMYEDGGFKDKWSNLTKEFEINKSLYDLFWIVYIVVDYVNITGDFEILDFEIKYMYDNECKKDINIGFSTLYDKCLKIINKAIVYDENNNYKLNENIKDVSTLLMLSMVLNDFDKILNHMNDEKNKVIFKKIKSLVMDLVKNNCFNGEFYINNLDDKINDKFYSDIYLLPQVLSLLCDDDESVCRKVIFSIEKYLVNKEVGFIREFFRKGSGFSKNCENIQNNKILALFVKALCKFNLNDSAYTYLNFMNPILKTITRNSANVYRREPYIIPSKIKFDNSNSFKILNEDFSHVSSLFYRVVLEDIIGFYFCKDGFYFNPCAPSNWNNYVIEYLRDESFYKIIVRKGEFKSLKINGEKHVEKIIKFQEKGTHIIDITI